MAHFEKYTAGAIGHMLAHYDRTHSSSTSKINESKTFLNYNLAAKDQPLSQLDFIHKRLSEIKVLKRKDVNVMCDWIVTAPQELAKDELPLFFAETYKFLNERYGKENVISAYVHLDETTPHIHYAFVPVVMDKKKNIPKLSAKERVPVRELKTFHPDLTKYMKTVFGRDIGIQNDATSLGNQTIKQLKQKSENLEKFKIEPVPVTELPTVVKKFLKEDKVIIDRQELERVNKAAEDAALIMSNTEAVSRQLSDKSEKADRNYDKSENCILKAEERAEQIISAAEAKAQAADENLKVSQEKWENQKSQEQAELDERTKAVEQREESAAFREKRNAETAEQIIRDAAYNDRKRRECDKREQELDKRDADQCGYYLNKIDNMSLQIKSLNARRIELANQNAYLWSEIRIITADSEALSAQNTDLKQEIADNDAKYQAIMKQRDEAFIAHLNSELERKEREVTDKYEPIIAEKNREIKNANALIEKLKSALDKAYSFIRDICLGVATLICGRDSNVKYNADLRGKPAKLAQAIINLGERVTAEAGFDDYSDEIETTYGICDSVREELDDIDPPRPYISEMVR